MPNASDIEDRLSLLLDMGFQPVREPTGIRVARSGRQSYRADAARLAMGTRVAITALGSTAARLEEAVGRAFEEMDGLIPVFSRHMTDSAVSQLNDAGRISRPPPQLANVLANAARFHHLTRGAFDVSVAPLVDLFHERLAGPTPAPPTDAEIAEIRASVGARHIRASRRVVRLRRPGMRLTLDGIAKGHIVDRMAGALEQRGVRDYLIDAGGDIRTRGFTTGRRPWTVGVRDPRDSSSFLDVVQPGTGAVATSGSYEHFYDPDRRFHHLVDAGTGLSPGHVASVSVLAPTAMAADALATAAFVMPPVAALALVDSLAGCACLILDRRGQRFSTRGWISAPTKPDPME
jgi:thiamine biosynthesis lipoprotein